MNDFDASDFTTDSDPDSDSNSLSSRQISYGGGGTTGGAGTTTIGSSTSGQVSYQTSCHASQINVFGGGGGGSSTSPPLPHHVLVSATNRPTSLSSQEFARHFPVSSSSLTDDAIITPTFGQPSSVIQQEQQQQQHDEDTRKRSEGETNHYGTLKLMMKKQRPQALLLHQKKIKKPNCHSVMSYVHVPLKNHLHQLLFSFSVGGSNNDDTDGGNQTTIPLNGNFHSYRSAESSEKRAVLVGAFRGECFCSPTTSSTSSSASKYVKPSNASSSSSCITHRESLCQSLSEKAWPFPLVRFASNESITSTSTATTVSSNEESHKKHFFSTPLHLRPKKRDQNRHSFIHSPRFDHRSSVLFNHQQQQRSTTTTSMMTVAAVVGGSIITPLGTTKKIDPWVATIIELMTNSSEGEGEYRTVGDRKSFFGKDCTEDDCNSIESNFHFVHIACSLFEHTSKLHLLCLVAKVTKNRISQNQDDSGYHHMMSNATRTSSSSTTTTAMTSPSKSSNHQMMMMADSAGGDDETSDQQEVDNDVDDSRNRLGHEEADCYSSTTSSSCDVTLKLLDLETGIWSDVTNSSSSASSLSSDSIRFVLNFPGNQAENDTSSSSASNPHYHDERLNEMEEDDIEVDDDDDDEATAAAATLAAKKLRARCSPAMMVVPITERRSSSSEVETQHQNQNQHQAPASLNPFLSEQEQERKSEGISNGHISAVVHHKIVIQHGQFCASFDLKEHFKSSNESQCGDSKNENELSVTTSPPIQREDTAQMLDASTTPSSQIAGSETPQEHQQTNTTTTPKSSMMMNANKLSSPATATTAATAALTYNSQSPISLQKTNSSGFFSASSTKDDVMMMIGSSGEINALPSMDGARRSTKEFVMNPSSPSSAGSTNTLAASSSDTFQQQQQQQQQQAHKTSSSKSTPAETSSFSIDIDNPQLDFVSVEARHHHHHHRHQDPQLTQELLHVDNTASNVSSMSTTPIKNRNKNKKMNNKLVYGDRDLPPSTLKTTNSLVLTTQQKHDSFVILSLAGFQTSSSSNVTRALFFARHLQGEENNNDNNNNSSTCTSGTLGLIRVQFETLFATTSTTEVVGNERLHPNNSIHLVYPPSASSQMLVSSSSSLSRPHSRLTQNSADNNNQHHLLSIPQQSSLSMNTTGVSSSSTSNMGSKVNSLSAVVAVSKSPTQIPLQQQPLRDEVDEHAKQSNVSLREEVHTLREEFREFKTSVQEQLRDMKSMLETLISVSPAREKSSL